MVCTRLDVPSLVVFQARANLNGIGHVGGEVGTSNDESPYLPLIVLLNASAGYAENETEEEF